MDTGTDRDRLVAMLRRLLDDLERHQDDYHHVTPPGLVEEARALLRAVDGENRQAPEQGTGSPFDAQEKP